MRHHFHRCMHLRVISVPVSELHGARKGGTVVLEELCDAKGLTPCLGLVDCDVLAPRQKQELLVERATRIREQQGRPTALSGVRRERAEALRPLREALAAERDRIVEENLRLEAEIAGGEDRELLGRPGEEPQLQAAGLSVGIDPSVSALRMERLDEIDRALEAMEDPAYGTCGLCGGEIEIERLRLHPVTRVCNPCARKAPAPPRVRIGDSL